MTGYSLHLGLNRVAQPGIPPLNACIKDALAMYELAGGLGYQAIALLDEMATHGHVVTQIRKMYQQLEAGDIFLLTYSGHGSQVVDQDGDEADGWDETWILYDLPLIDDELYQMWRKFAAGVRLVVLSDSCHSGTMVKSVPTPTLTAKKTVRDCRASGLLLASCQDSQVSMDGKENGAFTTQLLKVWNQGRFEGSYKKFHRMICAGLPASQKPNYLTFGEKNHKFLREKPFSL